MTGSFNGEFTYMTNSSKAQWLNNTKGWIEGMTDQKNNETTMKIYIEKTKSTKAFAAPIM
jgi:hypothetical protein